MRYGRHTYSETSMKMNRLTASGLAAALTLATPLAQADITGNIGVVSKYVLRGISNTASGSAENDGTAVQGGLDWSHASGLYAGYWGSNLDYVTTSPGGTANSVNGVENDLYAGYKAKMGSVTLNLGAIYYYYLNMDEGNAVELVAAVGAGPVTLGMKYLTDDVFWGNQGDIYWTADYTQPLPSDFTFGASLGFYTYDDSDSGDVLSNLELVPGSTTESSAFRHLNLTLSHPVANKAATMALTYIIGGEDRAGRDQDDQIVLGLSTTF